MRPSGQPTLRIATYPIDIEYAESLGLSMYGVDTIRFDAPPANEPGLIDEIQSKGIASGAYDYIIVD